MKEIAIIGAGGFGREVQWLLERLNSQSREWDIVGYFDDKKPCGANPLINGLPILGSIDDLAIWNGPLCITCAIGSSSIRADVINRIRGNKNLSFPTLIDPSVVRSERISFGDGCIVCASNVLTVDICIGDFVTINLDGTVGHDAILDSYVTLYPSVNVSGHVHLHKRVEIGTGSQILQGRTIENDTVIGAGAVVITDIPANCTAVGVPARVVKRHTSE
jgi:sugar O-acyltransferase (sialic acid O-acetyltransferase NeuD family)